jgi:putative PIN family toxin of toxin-antitoxin system
VVLDTNVVISALVWGGVPYQLLQAAAAGTVDLYTSPVLLDELRGVLARPHLAQPLVRQHGNVDQAVEFYARLCHSVEPQHTPRVVPHDSDDDHVVATAVEAQAHLIVSGDKHLLQLKESINIPVLKAGDALRLITTELQSSS